MKFSFVLFPALLGSAAAQGVTQQISPSGSTPAGCSASYDGSFEITVVVPVEGGSKRDLNVKKRDACGSDGILVVTLSDGVLLDAQKRTGYIAANYQFQFDDPPQAGAIYTAGYSVCGNGSLALGPSTTFYQCTSGSFKNLYDRSWAAQCSPVQLQVIECGGADPPAGQNPDGQAVATELVTTTIVKPLTDGQPQVITTVIPVPLCQISDGQAQVHTTPCASVTIEPSPTTTAAPVSQFSDGQIQVTATGTTAPETSPAPTSGGPTIVPPPIIISSSSSPSPVAPSITTSASSLSSNTTLSTISTLASQSLSTSKTTSPTSAPTAGASRHVAVGSMAGLAVGLVGAVFFL